MQLSTVNLASVQGPAPKASPSFWPGLALMLVANLNLAVVYHSHIGPKPLALFQSNACRMSCHACGLQN